MRVYISSDLEGCAGVVDWAQCRPGEHGYAEGRRLLLGEVNAAITGAIAGGATHVLVNDSHGLMANIPPDEIAGRASYLSGRHKPDYMMEGLDESFGAVFFVGYHGSMGSHGTLSHTYNPRAVGAVRINGVTAGESGINALVAQARRVPVALVTGDQYATEEARPFAPGAEEAIVKRSITRMAAESLHPEAARELIEAAARRAVERVVARELTAASSIALPVRLETDWLTADMAAMAAELPSTTLIADRTTAIDDGDPARCYRIFVTSVALTRGAADL